MEQKINKVNFKSDFDFTAVFKAFGQGGVVDEPSNWKEITIAEADEIIAEQERLANEEQNRYETEI